MNCPSYKFFSVYRSAYLVFNQICGFTFVDLSKAKQAEWSVLIIDIQSQCVDMKIWIPCSYVFQWKFYKRYVRQWTSETDVVRSMPLTIMNEQSNAASEKLHEINDRTSHRAKNACSSFYNSTFLCFKNLNRISGQRARRDIL